MHTSPNAVVKTGDITSFTVCSPFAGVLHLWEHLLRESRYPWLTHDPLWKSRCWCSEHISGFPGNPQISDRVMKYGGRASAILSVFGLFPVLLMLTSPGSIELCAAVGPEMNAQYLNLAYLVLSLHPVGSPCQHNHGVPQNDLTKRGNCSRWQLLLLTIPNIDLDPCFKWDRTDSPQANHHESVCFGNNFNNPSKIKLSHRCSISNNHCPWKFNFHANRTFRSLQCPVERQHFGQFYQQFPLWSNRWRSHPAESSQMEIIRLRCLCKDLLLFLQLYNDQHFGARKMCVCVCERYVFLLCFFKTYFQHALGFQLRVNYNLYGHSLTRAMERRGKRERERERKGEKEGRCQS